MALAKNLIDQHPTICIADDRLTAEMGIRLLISSITRHSPKWPIALCIPNPSAEFQNWLHGYDNVTLNGISLQGSWNGYNIKPQLLMEILNSGAESAVWIDSDIITLKSLDYILTDLGNGSLVITEETMGANHYDGDALRARAWGLPIGRKVPFQLNTGVLGVTSKHLPLLKRWKEVLESEEYISAYKQPWAQRPSYYAGDQEVITALLCSKEFSGIKLKILYRGRDIIQYFGLGGYSTIERLGHFLGRLPTFIHAQGPKPWLAAPATKQSFLHRFRGVSPYSFAALDYQDELTDKSWLSGINRREPKNWRARAPLSGFLLALGVDIFRMLRWGHTGGEPRKGNAAIADYNRKIRGKGR